MVVFAALAALFALPFAQQLLLIFGGGIFAGLFFKQLLVMGMTILGGILILEYARAKLRGDPGNKGVIIIALGLLLSPYLLDIFGNFIPGLASYEPIAPITNPAASLVGGAGGNATIDLALLISTGVVILYGLKRKEIRARLKKRF